jgi:hypothetical protein
MENSRISFEPSEDLRQGSGGSVNAIHRDASAASINQERVLYDAWRVSVAVLLLTPFNSNPLSTSSR